jgi:hypothetical protein
MKFHVEKYKYTYKDGPYYIDVWEDLGELNVVLYQVTNHGIQCSLINNNQTTYLRYISCVTIDGDFLYIKGFKELNVDNGKKHYEYYEIKCKNTTEDEEVDNV